MALSESKIKGLRELAARGIGGEADNAKAILERNGIPLTAPKAKAAPNPGYTKGGTGSRHTQFNSEEFEEIFAGAFTGFDFNDLSDQLKQAQRRQRDAEAMRISPCNSVIQSKIIQIIAQRLFGEKGRNGVWNKELKCYQFGGRLSISDVSVIRETLNRNMNNIDAAIDEAIKNIKLI